MLNLRKAYILTSLLKVNYRSVFNESSKAFIFLAPPQTFLGVRQQWLREEPVRTSAWEAILFQKFAPWVLFYFGLNLHIFLWKMSATPGACIKPGCLARRPLCHRVNLPSCVARRPLFHKLNLPRCGAWRRHFIMTCECCDIFSTGQTNILDLCYLFGKTWPAQSSATQATEINTLDETTGKVIDVSHTHIPLRALMIPLKRVKLRGVV